MAKVHRKRRKEPFFPVCRTFYEANQINAHVTVLSACLVTKLSAISNPQVMGAFMSSLGFNQPFFLTVIGIFLMLSVTIFIIQDASGNDEESLREERVLLGMYKNRNIALYRPSDLPRSPPSSLNGINSTHLS